jgi:hypothetical protein
MKSRLTGMTGRGEFPARQADRIALVAQELHVLAEGLLLFGRKLSARPQFQQRHGTVAQA